jgi:hypothetical protein
MYARKPTSTVELEPNAGTAALDAPAVGEGVDEPQAVAPGSGIGLVAHLGQRPEAEVTSSTHAGIAPRARDFSIMTPRAHR